MRDIEICGGVGESEREGDKDKKEWSEEEGCALDVMATHFFFENFQFVTLCLAYFFR